MDQVVTIGLDIAKSVFQVHGVDGEGAVVMRQRLTRARMLAFFAKKAPCLVGLEACGSAHYWGRELTRLGHEVRLIPPSYVKPYVKRQKNDAMPKRSAKRSPGPVCALSRSNRLSSKASWCYTERVQFLFVSARNYRMPSAGTWPSLASSPPSGAMVCNH